MKLQLQLQLLLQLKSENWDFWFVSSIIFSQFIYNINNYDQSIDYQADGFICVSLICWTTFSIFCFEGYSVVQDMLGKNVQTSIFMPNFDTNLSKYICTSQL